MPRLLTELDGWLVSLYDARSALPLLAAVAVPVRVQTSPSFVSSTGLTVLKQRESTVHKWESTKPKSSAAAR